MLNCGRRVVVCRNCVLLSNHTTGTLLEEAKRETPRLIDWSVLTVVLSQEDLVDFEVDEEEEEDEGEEEIAPGKEKSPAAPPAPARAPAAAAPAPATVNVVGPWQAPPDTAATARVRLSLYFALCVKSRPMLSGLLEAYVTAAPAAQEGLKAELPLLARAAARGFGEAGVVGLVAAAPVRAKALVLVMLDLLVPRETNKPSPELVAAVRRLRDTRLANVAKEEGGEEGEGAKVGGGVTLGGTIAQPGWHTRKTTDALFTQLLLVVLFGARTHARCLSLGVPQYAQHLQAVLFLKAVIASTVLYSAVAGRKRACTR